MNDEFGSVSRWIYELKDGELHVPDRPGHGLVLQEDALARLRLQ